MNYYDCCSYTNSKNNNNNNNDNIYNGTGTVIIISPQSDSRSG